MQRKFLRLPGLKARFGIGDTTVYKGVCDGTLPPPIKLTKRTSVWVEDEIDAVVGARIAGKSDAEIKRLVERLVEQRQQPQQAA